MNNIDEAIEKMKKFYHPTESAIIRRDLCALFEALSKDIKSMQNDKKDKSVLFIHEGNAAGYCSSGALTVVNKDGFITLTLPEEQFGKAAWKT